jgi:sec-independent protein translocase protein TatC
MATANDPDGQEMSFIAHLLELRQRLLQIVLSVFLIFLVLISFANHLFTWIAHPLLRFMPAGTQMIAIDVASPFFVPMKLVLVLSIFISMPIILYHFWEFIAPGLYKTERELMLPLLVSSIFLFYTGMLFAYFIVFPVVFGFMLYTTPVGVAMMTDIGRYLDFVLLLFFAFGITFEIPIATILLVWTGIVTPDGLIEKRPYIIVGAFTIAMFLTPPDVFSQTLLAVPMWLLFEVGVFFSRIIMAKKQQREQEEEAANNQKGTDLATQELNALNQKLAQLDKKDKSEP